MYISLQDPLSPKALQSPTKPSASTTADELDMDNLLSQYQRLSTHPIVTTVLIIDANSQDQDVFVFNAPQTGLPNAKGSATALNTTTKPPHQPNENAFNFVAKVDHAAQATAQTQRTKRQRYKICSCKGTWKYACKLVFIVAVLEDCMTTTLEQKDSFK